MKSYTSTIIALLTCLVASAHTNNERNVLAEYEKNQTGIVSRSDTLAVVYKPSPEGTRVVLAKEFDSSKPIYFDFFSTTNRPFVLYNLRPEYGFRISAATETGEPVKPTHKGAKYGKNFDALKGYDDEAIPPQRWKTVAGLPNSYHGYGARMPAPDELFNFKKPGKYTMTIEAACFPNRYFPPHPRPKTNCYLVKFPPVKIQVVKKEVENDWKSKGGTR